MQAVLNVFQWILANYQAVITDVNGILVAAIALFTLIPGDQPEKFLQGIVDFISKFSRK